MESRVKKYYSEDIQVQNQGVSATRSSRNANLYKHIYGKYENLDNLPISDNTNEIDMDKLKELISNQDSTEEKHVQDNLNVLEQRKRQIDEQKIYDINKILEKAKHENSKLKNTSPTKIKPRKELLSTLESTELSVEEINEAKKYYQEQFKELQSNKKQDELSMTRELKYKNLSLEQEENALESNKINNSSFDLFEDLKSTENTITTKPVKSELNNNHQHDIRSEDTSDIDIIKNIPNAITNDFFTNSYEFSKTDFADIEEDDFFEKPKKGGLLKIFLLMLAIAVFVGVIIYFVGTYGLGLS